MTAAFVNVTEIEGQRISQEQLDRMCHRYYWAARHAEGRDVLEIACGAGQGLELLRRAAHRLVAGDYSPEVLEIARSVTPPSVPLSKFGAEDLPFSDGSFDIVLLFEALYYVNAQDEFLREAHRVLKPGGSLLIATANKDLFDFTPSPYSTRYLGASELDSALRAHDFDVEVYGYLNIASIGLRQRLLRPAKALAARIGIMPKTMRGKEWLKKIFFGKMVTMPRSLADIPFRYVEPERLHTDRPDRDHKVIYCRAIKRD